MGTARGEHDPRPPRHRAAAGTLATAADALALLAEHGLVVAPHVAAHLRVELAGDAAAVVEVATELSAAGRLGRTALPDPLPLVPAIERDFGAAVAELDADERALLLTAAVCVDDRVDVLLAACGATMAGLLAGAASRHLLLVAGHVAFADPRMRIHVHASAGIAERTAVHAALAAAYDRLDEPGLALWHRALSTLEGDERFAAGLIALADEAEASGRSEWAHAVAREAACHARGADLARARCSAGRAAFGAGFVEDAVAWLGAALADEGPDAASALPLYVEAHTLLRGDVPGELVEAALDRIAAGGGDRAALVRAAVVGARLHAERGQGAAAAALLALAGPPAAEGPVSVSGLVADALAEAAHGDPERALRRLRTAAGPLDPAEPAGYSAASPLARAARAVAVAAIELHRGNVRRAHRELRQASAASPVALPLGGLGVILARRLDVLVEGAVGGCASALGAAHPAERSPAARAADLVDRALVAFSEGRDIEAAALVDLAEDLAGGEGGAWAPPGLDRTDCLLPGAGPAVRASTPVAVQGGLTAARVRALAVDADPARRDDAAALSRLIDSPYERGRCEFLLGRLGAADGDAAAARRHLVNALGLLRDAGAVLWLGRVQRELAALPEPAAEPAAARASRVGDEPAGPVAQRPVRAGDAERTDARRGRDRTWFAEPGEPGRAEPEAGPRPAAGTHPDPADPLGACRASWAGVLTERELEVALLVAAGASNREAAARLFVSVRTVEVHVGRVFAKLGVHSRVELAVAAHRIRPDALAATG